MEKLNQDQEPTEEELLEIEEGYDLEHELEAAEYWRDELGETYE